MAKKTQLHQLLALLRLPDDLKGADALALAAFTAENLAQAMNVKPESVHRTLRRARELDRAHVYIWLDKSSVWVKGEGHDAVKPKLTPEEKRALQKRYNKEWKEKRQDVPSNRGDLIQTPVRELGRTEAMIQRAKATRRSWFSQLEDATEQRGAA